MDRLPYKVCEPLYQALGLKFNSSQVMPLKNQDRFPVLGGGERGGKSWTAVAQLLPHVVLLPAMKYDTFYFPDGSLRFDPKIDKPRSPHFVLFGPNYAEPRVEFTYLENWLRELDMLPAERIHVSKPTEGPWRMVTKEGVVISTWSMEDPTSIRAIDLEGALICEAGKCPYSGVERVQGRVSAKRGFIIYSGTMEEAQRWYQEWMLIGQRPNNLGIVSYSLPTYTNLHEFPGGRNDPEIKRLEAIYPEDIFAMRILAEPRPPRDRVLKEVTNEHIHPLDYPDDASIEVWIDPGYASAYAVLWVAWWHVKVCESDCAPDCNLHRRQQFHFFDEFYEQGLTTMDIINKCRVHPNWPRVKYGVIDIAAQGHRDAGESALEIWKRRTSVFWNMRYYREEPLIERIRTSAKMMQFSIDPKCVGFIAECGLGEPVFPEMHPWKYPTDRDARIISEKPIDRWNHTAKAVGYGLMHHLGSSESVRKPTTVNRLRQNTPARTITSSRLPMPPKR